MLDKNRFRGAIANAGLTHYELAKRIGISKNTLSSKINGKGCFDTEQIDCICDMLEIDDILERARIFLAKSSQFRDENQSWRLHTPDTFSASTSTSNGQKLHMAGARYRIGRTSTTGAGL